jgi:hypothetical protein
MQTVLSAVFRDTLKEYHEVHDAVWRCLGTKEGEYLVERLGSLMARLDKMMDGWWMLPRPA